MARENYSTTASVDVSKAISHGSSGIKKKLRDIQRLLKRENLHSDVRIANERALTTLNLELENVQLNHKARKMSVKYHKVRFFEKKKATRFYSQSKKTLEDLNKRLENGDDKILQKEIKKQKKNLKHCEIDLVYILNFPKAEKYISLYAPNEIGEDMSKKAKEGLKKTNQLREEYKKKFADQLKEGRLEVSIEDGLAGIKNTEKIRVDNQKAVDDVEDPKKDNQDKEADDFFE